VTSWAMIERCMIHQPKCIGDIEGHWYESEGFKPDNAIDITYDLWRVELERTETNEPFFLTLISIKEV